MANRKRNKVRRIAPRPRNAPKPFDDGMRHFIVSVPKHADPAIDQTVRDQVAETIEASVQPRKPEVEPTPSAIEAALRQQPAFHEPPEEEPDYSGWFQPEPHVHFETHAMNAEEVAAAFENTNGAGTIAATVARHMKKPGCLAQLAADLVDAIYEGARLFAKGATVTAGVLFTGYAMWRYL